MDGGVLFCEEGLGSHLNTKIWVLYENIDFFKQDIFELQPEFVMVLLCFVSNKPMENARTFSNPYVTVKVKFSRVEVGDLV